MNAIASIAAGHGRIHLRGYSSTAVFSELTYAYPLKLLSPRSSNGPVAIVYVLSYGGGLVGGDRINLSIDVSDSSSLVMLTQGSTKVFKIRSTGRRATVEPSALSTGATLQDMDVNIGPDSGLFLLPDPVTCFRAASYQQRQTFRLSADASVLLLDWVTAGRTSIGEDWAFARYHSVNEVWLDGKRLARDVLLLEDDTMVTTAAKLPPRPLAVRLAPYTCYATAILCGPKVAPIVLDLTNAFAAITVFKQGKPPDLVWSLSPIEGGRAHILRVAAIRTEYVKDWLKHAFRSLAEVLGQEVYRSAFT